MEPDPEINVMELIDRHGLSRAQIAIVGLCGLIAVFDGLDLQAIGLAAPAIAAALHIAPPALGPVFSAALAGLAVGAFGLGLAADRIGRKRVLIGSTVCFGVFTLCTALASSMNALLLFRFCTGLGLGGAMPSFISLGAEYVPRRFRATIVSGLWAGFPIGGVIGGLLASRLIPQWGWPSIFWVGGTLPLLLAAALWFVLPESIGFLVNRNAPPQRIARLLERVCPGAHPSRKARFVLGEERALGVRVRQLFSAGRAGGTLLLWASFFIVFMMLVTNSAWSPTLLHAEGVEVAQSAIAMATFNFGSVIGTSLAGWLISRLGVISVLPVSCIGGALAIGSVGYAAHWVLLVTFLEGLFGLFLGCASSGLIVLAALFYPTAIRSTGVGWSMGMGRIGSFVGPLAVGTLVGKSWPVDSVFVAVGVPALVAAVTTALVGLHYGRAEASAALAAEPLLSLGEVP
ncbi:MAG TPA: MFS transporter [Xanthobacteraceae bacterium]|nr:MFS transporter [Xanthobacteraceae bacterium]